MSPNVYIIGAGMAGLSAAVRLAKSGSNVTVFEAAPHGGGRCRSFYDKSLDTIIDNGAHLMMSGNSDIMALLKLTGGTDEVYALERTRFDFLDVSNDQRWSVDLGAGRGKMALLAWIFDARRRPPNVSPWTLILDVLALKRSKGKTVADCLDIKAPHFRSFWEPLCVGVLNANANEAAAELLWAVFEETVLRGGYFARPLLTRRGLGAALVDPALKTLKDLGVDVQFGKRLQGLDFKDGRVACLNFTNGAEVLGAGDRVILAIPHFALQGVLDNFAVPKGAHAILNVHFRLDEDVEAGFMGLIGSPVQWVFTRGNIASVTMSVADDWVKKSATDIATALWPDVVKVLRLKNDQIPPYRVIKERRATFVQSPKALTLRADPQTKYENLFLAGDWTNTGLPATIESAVRSGRKAAEAVLG
ncbi:MAG: amine oxidase [Rhodospirillaceae bacterium]|nr:MAG: amine oxidase [Rhodospirillaceae bacterium]